jgi:hypothetical protein
MKTSSGNSPRLRLRKQLGIAKELGLVMTGENDNLASGQTHLCAKGLVELQYVERAGT